MDELLAWMVETAIACLDDNAGLVTAVRSMRCGHCGEAVEDLGRVDEAMQLTARAFEAAQCRDHAEVRSSVSSLLDVTDTDSRNRGLVWVLGVVVHCVDAVLHRAGRLPVGPGHGDER
ncbi:hypothetical protein ACFFSW_17115 [Saccharothrix longispora]|uniref:Tetratricopeptide repeat protein n=1 Tax=Saccharothrix longispora TaxID=33920 RepID=A0ABU1PSR9_9PSEU|nr:hypothetical protein [Saccharothrix longispora]MDR6593636.1 hypothetical protein [Saccharothrix longispora]